MIKKIIISLLLICICFPFQHIIHSYNFEAFQLDFDWNMKKINDSITKVIVGVNSKNQSISTRIKKLTGTSPVKKLLDRASE